MGIGATLSANCSCRQARKFQNLLDQVPIFTPSIGRDSSARLNLSHSGCTGLHVVVMVIGEMQSYMRAWPGHMIMALPDSDALGRGEYHTQPQTTTLY